MQQTILIKNAIVFGLEGNFGVHRIVRLEGCDVLIKNGRFEKIAPNITCEETCIEVDGTGKYLIPGIIDDQVHFRDMGAWKYKSNFYMESRAAVAGGTTSFMDQYNLPVPTDTLELLNAKYDYAGKVSLANFSFFMGVSNKNYDEVMKVVQHHKQQVCGLKMFLGSSTGNLLLEDEIIIQKVMATAEDLLIAAHCESEAIIKANKEKVMCEFGNQIKAEHHPMIRNTEACYISSSRAIELAKANGARFHVYHLSTANEIYLLDRSATAVRNRQITSEACVHHLYFNDEDYKTYGNQIVCNPAIKSEDDRRGLIQGLVDGLIDIIATDHAAHTLPEKNQKYWDTTGQKQLIPSGIPLVQHSFNMMHQLVLKGEISLELAIQKMTIDVAECYRMPERGAIAEGFKADCFLFDPNETWKVLNRNNEFVEGNVLTTAGWSPFHGQLFTGKNTMTIVNGNIVYKDDIFDEIGMGERLVFERES